MNASRPPVLVLCAHGTDDPAGRRAVDALAADVAVLVAVDGVRVVSTWVDVQHPQVDVVVPELVAAGERVVVVPALLSAGYHTQVDIADAVAAHPGRAWAGDPLGPDRRLAAVLHRRLVEVGATPDDTVVLVAAGSSRASSVRDVEDTARTLAARWGSPVAVGFGAKAEPSIATAVARAREQASGRVVLASYLLAPGVFQDRLAGHGADVITAPLAGAPELAAIVVDRFRAVTANL